ncbi:MAG: cation-translocating P-type ATPase, partial [Planctomycetaceae bacterium]
MQDSSRQRPDSPWSVPPSEVAKLLGVEVTKGLAADDVRRRFEEHGPNQLREEAVRGMASIFFGQFAELMIVLLAIAAVISALIGEWTDSALIGIIVLANAVVGTAQEWRAEQAVAALKKLSQPTVRVLRDGRIREISAEELVPGDVIDVKAGDLISADCRLIDAADLQTDEAPLTGESLPVQKSVEAVEGGTALPDRHSMIYSGTAVTFGHGRGVVVSTGMETELGHIAGLLQETQRAQTPLQAKLAVLSKRLAIIVVLLSIIVFAAGVFRESSENWNRKLLGDMLLVAVSLAVAAIPEGLPAVITVALALGSQRAAKRKAIVRRLAAVETLGSVDVICSDKTGTLTQNLMSVADLIGAGDDETAKQRLLEFGILCNDAEFDPSGKIVGSATEAAILRAGADQKVDISRLKKEWPRVAEVPFSSAQKKMVTLHRTPAGGRLMIVKGAAEAILEHCNRVGIDLESAAPLDDKGRGEWKQRADRLAGTGRRLLAVGLHEADRDDLHGINDAPVDGLVLVGMIGIVDPVRPEAKDAIRLCRSAGIRPVMITGDHPGTARAIAEELELADGDDRTMPGAELDGVDDETLVETAQHVAVYARVSPNHKLRIVKALQARKSVVGMTGDGVNDAPALKQSDIGIAMGVTGTDVSRQAADMILADDNFSTIVAAV